MTRTPLHLEAAQAHEILWDGGVLGDGAVCELSGWAGAGDHALLPHRPQAVAAEAHGTTLLREREPAGSFSQVVVHLQKSRRASLHDVAIALRLLSPDGQLLVLGYNALGIRSFQKQLDRLLGVPGRVLSNRRRGRVLSYPRAGVRLPDPPTDSRFAVDAPTPMTLRAEPGVFSEDRLDPGSALLLSHLSAALSGAPPRRLLDLGCGTGVLALQALSLLPAADALLLDADLRAVRSARDNAAEAGLSARADVRWWDAAEPLPDTGPRQLVLCNPPFHGGGERGKQVDLGPAFAMFEHARSVLSPDGQALVVANRTLPYEPALRRLGALETLEQARGFKLLRLRPA